MRLGSSALATERVERRLAAILAADVAGYSRLMGTDEEGTHERLKGHLRDLIDPKIKEHRGRIVKNTGDGMLAELSSVVDAVRCAAQIQRAMINRNADIPEKPWRRDRRTSRYFRQRPQYCGEAGGISRAEWHLHLSGGA